MEDNFPERLLPFDLDLVVRRGLGRTLLLCFLGLAMVPLAIVGCISYQTAYHRLEQDVRQDIRIAAELKRLQLQVFFDDRSAGTNRQAKGHSTDSLFNTADQMLRAPMGRGAGIRIYLVDSDLRLMAGANGVQDRDGGATVDTAQTQLWCKNMLGGNSTSPPPSPFTYAGPGGSLVMGTHAEIHLGKSPYALIVEIDTKAAFAAVDRLLAIILSIVILSGVGVVAVSAALARAIAEPVRNLSQSMLMVAKDRFDHVIQVAAKNEIGDLAAAFGSMVHRLRAVKAQNDSQSRFMAGLTSLHRLIGGEQELGELGLNTLELLSDFLDLCQADLFILDDDGGLTCVSRFPGHPDSEPRQVFDPDGRVGQAIIEKRMAAFRKDARSGVVTPIPTSDQANLIVVPLVWQRTVRGFLELEKTSFFSQIDYRFVEAAAEVIALAVNAASTRRQEATLLKQTREQAKKLEIREAALEASTRELQAQSRAFQAYEEKLQLKQLELEAANAQMVKNAADLEAHMAILETQKLDMQKQNAELEKTHRELAEKARQLEISSRYKTEFMANMSHELRTPLNSILLLSRLLLENKEKTLTPKQSEFSRTIHSAGEDLLNLINEILDLAKVESGKMELALQAVRVQSIAKAMQVSFAPLADQSGVLFTIQVAPDVPEQLISDRKRIEQIIKNFLSNAFKFTAKGSIRLEITVYHESMIGRRANQSNENGCLAISVVDTGIGIPAAKHEMVFEAFQQVDGSTRRKYGGTGLGLSISRELARLLGGKITLESQDGRGSRFTLHLPIIPLPEKEPAMIRKDPSRSQLIEPGEPPPPAEEADSSQGMSPFPDGRNQLAAEDEYVLIIDAEAGKTAPIKDHANRNGYKVLVAEQFQTGLHFADDYRLVAIFANLRLPDASGWAMIRRIKANPKSRHIPVFTLSPHEDGFAAAVHGAAGHVNEPATPRRLEAAFHCIEKLRSSADRTLLVVAQDLESAARTRDAVGGRAIRIMTATSAAEAKAALNARSVHAVILHPAMLAREQDSLLAGLQHDPMPVFLYSGTPLDTRSRDRVSPYSDTVNLNLVDTSDQLLLGLVLSLHLPPEALDERHRHRLQAIDNRQFVLKGRKVLLVDDDMRTVFAVSNVLEDQGAEVLTGKTGKESLDKLNGFPDIDLVLMDVMISEVDGYQAIREIRNRDRYRHLPIIALTAKAMQGDRAKCIKAGADDYLAKPVDLDKLTSMLKIWLEPLLAAPKHIGA